MSVIFSRRAAGLYLLAASSLTVLSVVLDRSVKTPTGLRVTTELQLSRNESSPSYRQTVAGTRLSTHIGLDLLLSEEPVLSRGPFRARWAGVWHVPEPGSFDFFLGANDRVGLTIDGRRVGAAGSSQIRTVELDAGFHDLLIDYRQIRGDSAMYVQWSASGGLPRRFDGDALFPDEPSATAFTVNQRLHVLRRLALLVWIVPVMVLIVRTGIRVTSRLRPELTPRVRGRVVLGVAVVSVAFLGYFSTLRLLEPNVSERDDLVFSADAESTIQALVWGPSAPRATNHPLFLLVRPLAKVMETAAPGSLTRTDAILAALALIAALNCLTMYAILSRLLSSAAMAAWFSGLYAVFLSNLVLFGVPEVYSLATLTVLLYLYFALGTRGISDLSRATLFGVLAALAGLVNPPLLSLSVVYWVSLWREHSWVRLAKLGAVSTSVAGICFSAGYLLASGLVSRTGAGYRPLTLSTAFSDQAVTAFGSGLTHLDTFGSWANVGDPALIGTVLLSFVFYSVITPAHSLANHLTQADAWGYFSSLSGLVSVVTYGALLLGAVFASARGDDPIMRGLLVWFVLMVGFYTYFSPHHAMLYAVQVAPVLVLVTTTYFSRLSGRFSVKYIALATWTWLLVDRNGSALLAFVAESGP